MILAYVTYNAFHSNLALPRSALRAYVADGPTLAATHRLEPSPWVSIGWGDMRFYRGQGFGLSRAADLVRAAVWPGNLATVHLQRSGDPEQERGDWKTLRLRLSPSDLQAMVRRIDASFALQDGQPVAAAAGPEEIYFSARGAFSIGEDCNHWIGDVVGATGARHNRLLDTVSTGLELDLRLRAGAQP